MRSDSPKNRTRFAELHSHLGASVSPAVLWDIAHDQGIRLLTKDYWEFEDMVVIKTPDLDNPGFKIIDDKYYKMCELIQSSPDALQSAVRRVIGGAYRASNIVLHELRYDPAKRNRGGERDLDYIILAVLNGVERAMLEYPDVRAGVIIELDRTFPYKLNEIIYKKACQYQHRGIIGVDMAGPQHESFDMKEYVDLFRDAKKRGFGTTIHTGEEGDLAEMRYVVSDIEPDRIGHGVLAAQDPDLMREMVDKGITLELCPTSNMNVVIFRDWKLLKTCYRTLYDAGVKLTINTDGPEMHNTNLVKEFSLLKEHGIFNDKEIEILIQNAFMATFLRPASG